MTSHSEQKNQSHVPGPKTWHAFWSTDCPCGCIRATLEVGKRWNGIEKTMVSGKGWKILGNWWKLWKMMLNNVVMLIRAYFLWNTSYSIDKISGEMSTEYVFNWVQNQVPIIRPKMWSESSIQTFITEPCWAWNRRACRIPTEQCALLSQSDIEWTSLNTSC